MALLLVELDKRIGNAQAWRDTFAAQMPEMPIRIWPEAGAAGEVARQGVRVNAVCPGPVDTRMIHDLEEQLAPGNAASIAERYRAAIPSGRYTTAEEIANMVLFLCSDLASNTTGGQFVVDGGRTSAGGAVTNLVARTPTLEET